MTEYHPLILTLIPFVFLLAWAVLGIIAPTFEGLAPRNNPFRILRSKKAVLWDGTVSDFAHVQEKGEFRARKVAGIAVGLIATIAAMVGEADPVFPALLIPILTVAVDGFLPKVSPLDYGGHGAEIIAAEDRYGAGSESAKAYRRRETESVASNYDISFAEAQKRLARWDWLARFVFVLARW